MVINGLVLSIPESYLSRHPGGEGVLMEFAGKDGTKMFKENDHSELAIDEMKSFKIGVVSWSVGDQ
jgi:cytochrome b involved in lipid metabolism